MIYLPRLVIIKPRIEWALDQQNLDLLRNSSRETVILAESIGGLKGNSVGNLGKHDFYTVTQAVEKPVKVFPLNHSGNGRKRDLMGQTSDFTWFQQVSTGFDRLKKQVSAKLGGFNQAEQWPCHERHDGQPNHRDQRTWKVVQSDVTTVSNTSHPRISRIYAYDCIYSMYSDELRTWNRDICQDVERQMASG